MKEVLYRDIVTSELLLGAIENNEMHGFKEDFHVLHCLLRRLNPSSVLEIGTHMGRGTKIICNAVPSAKVYSLDLSSELGHLSLQYPSADKIGVLCDLPYTQIYADSLAFDYGSISVDAVFIDGEHDYKHVSYETTSLIKQGVTLFIFHDADMDEVFSAIKDVFNEAYELTRVIDTRILYAIKI